MVNELLDKFSAIYGTQKLYYRIHKSSSVVPVLSQMNRIYTLILREISCNNNNNNNILQFIYHLAWQQKDSNNIQ
jgi:hypothetical protein